MVANTYQVHIRSQEIAVIGANPRLVLLRMQNVPVACC